MMSAETKQSICERIDDVAHLLLSPQDAPPDGSDLLEHARECERCTARLREEQRVHGALAAWTPEVPARLDRVSTAIQADLAAAAAWRPATTLALAVFGLALGTTVVLGGGLRANLGALGAGPIVAVLAALAVGLIWFLAGMWRFGRSSRLASPWASAALLAIAAAIPLLAVGRSWTLPDASAFLRHGFPCGGLTLALAGGTTAVYLLLAWPARRSSDFPRAGSLAGAAGALVGAGALFLECPSTNGAHLGIWHGAAMLLAFVICAGLARLVARPFVPLR